MTEHTYLPSSLQHGDYRVLVQLKAIYLYCLHIFDIIKLTGQIQIWRVWSLNKLGTSWWLKSKESACNAGDPGSIPGWEDPLEKEMATHSGILSWEIPWTEKPGGL